LDEEKGNKTKAWRVKKNLTSSFYGGRREVCENRTVVIIFINQRTGTVWRKIGAAVWERYGMVGFGIWERYGSSIGAAVWERYGMVGFGIWERYGSSIGAAVWERYGMVGFGIREWYGSSIGAAVWHLV